MKAVKEWTNIKRKNAPMSFVNSIEDLKGEVEKLQKEEEKYIKAYGADVMTLEELKGHKDELRAKISSLKTQVKVQEQRQKENQIVNFPSEAQLEMFCQRVRIMLESLKFDARQKLIRDTIEKVVSNQHELHVEGYLSINANYYVVFETIRGNRWTT